MKRFLVTLSLLVAVAFPPVFSEPGRLSRAHAQGEKINGAQLRSQAWAAHKNKRLGFTVHYPNGWFVPEPEPPDKDGRTFVSKDGKARIAAFGMLDLRWHGAELFYEKMIVEQGRVDDELASKLYTGDLKSQGAAYEGVTEKKVTANWITLTGKRGDQIYLEKYIFSCADKVISVLADTFPQADQATYGFIIKKLTRLFGAGSGSETPVCM